MQASHWKLVSAFLLGLAVAGWGGRFGAPSSPVALAAGSGAGSGAEVVSFATELVNGVQIVYLIDPAQKVLSVYEFDTRKTKLKLAAVRQYSADHQLAEFNNEAPNVADIEKLVRQR